MRKLFSTILHAGALLMLALLLAPLLKAQELADVASNLAQLQQREGRLRDARDIERLQHAYGYYVDKQQWEDVRDLFARDAVLEPGGRGRFLGLDHIYEYLRTGLGPSGPVPGKLQGHLLGQGIVSISPDGNAASGRWSALVVGGTSWSDQFHENSCVKEDGVWKLASVHSVTSMHAAADTGWASGTQAPAPPESALPPPDLPPWRVYLSFPNYYNEPFHYPNPVTGRAAPPPDAAAGGAAFGQP